MVRKERLLKPGLRGHWSHSASSGQVPAVWAPVFPNSTFSRRGEIREMALSPSHLRITVSVKANVEIGAVR